MIKIPGYTVEEQLSTSESSRVYRGYTNLDKMPVIIKIAAAESPSRSDLAKIKWEFEIARNLEIEGVVKPIALITFQNYALILEDFGGVSLSSFMGDQKIELLSGLRIATSLAKTLGRIHQKGIIHKDIKPSNIIINPKTAQIKLTDFSTASRISGEKQPHVKPDLLEGTLTYMAPEQTGRMNRSIDHRADLYSFGITLYKMFTGVLPFEDTGMVELIHCHMAILPPPPTKYDPDIPAPLSDIIMKLLAKNAEDRYQSAFGLGHDLEKCLAQLKTGKKAQRFTLGQNDIPTTMQIPEKLYGRETELAELMEAFKQTAQGRTEVLIVKGAPGIGKSVLINELHKPVIEQKGYFTSGKFDQFKHDLPYIAIRQAFTDLMRQLLCESTARITDWGEKIKNNIGPNGQILIDLIPELGYLIGAQPPVESLPPTQSQNRFNIVFNEFVNVFARKEHPLVLFLDDVQWADWATLKLVEYLVTSRYGHPLLLIMAYRDNEVDESHPLMPTLDAIAKAGIKTRKIQLTPLPFAGVYELISDTLACIREKTVPLTRMVMAKTHGNPFFIIQFLKDLYKKELIRFDTDTYSWTWDIEAINTANITSNVVDFMCSKIQQLPPAERKILMVASCIGSRFDLDLLAEICGINVSEAVVLLQESQRQGLLIPVDTAYKYVETLPDEGTPAQTAAEAKIPYMFLHDRIQHAAYSLIPEDRKNKLHKEVGRIMLEQTPADELENKLFEIVQHLNPSCCLISSREEIIELAGLNLKASRKAKAANAYEMALTFADKGLNLIGKKGWLDNYELCRDLTMEQAECEYLAGNFNQAENVLASLLDDVKSAEEKARVYDLKGIIYAHLDKQQEAISAGLNGLRLLGLNIPKDPGRNQVTLEFIKAYFMLGGRKPEDLLKLPKLTDPKRKLVIQVIMNTIAPAYLTNQNLFAFLCLRGFRHTLQYGVTEVSPYMLNCYAFALADNFGAYKSAYDFGSASFILNEKIPNIQMRSKITALFALFFSHWRDPLEDGTNMMKRAFNFCIEAGDFIFAGFSSCTLALYLLSRGVNFDELLNETKTYLNFAENVGDQFTIDFYTILKQFIKNQKGLTLNRLSLSDETFDEEKKLHDLNEQYNANLLFHYHYWKGITLYLQDDFESAYNVLKNGCKFAHGVALLPSTADQTFYYTLALIAHYPDISFAEKGRCRRVMTSNKKRLKKWAENCPENFLHKYLLVKAAITGMGLNQSKTINLYNQAIDAAKEHDFIQAEALAKELLARFHFRFGRDSIGIVYIREAARCYLKWGAETKVQALKKEYVLDHIPEKTSYEVRKSADKVETHPHISLTGTLQEIDLVSVLRASQTISEEIVLSNLLKEIMKIVIQNAGAQKGFLILEKNNSLFIEAEGQIDKDDIKVLQSIPVESSPDLSAGIINYVRRTMEMVVLKNAAEEGLFVSDPYVIANHPKSILCIPILKQKKLNGILYLENNLLTDAFTSERLEVLSLLAAQASISLENAKLYEDVEQQVSQLQQADEEQRKLYSQLIQSQKMEAVGRLAGGVAHDFNNILTTIIGYCELTCTTLPENDPLRENIETIWTAADKAAALTRQLLTFSRKQLIEKKVVNLNEIIKNMGKMLERLIGEDISIDLMVNKSIGNISADPGQLEQILMNLAVNARDAMPFGGHFTVETDEVYLDENFTRLHEDVEVGNYVILMVSDTGEGIAPELQEKIFEPFFTTKEKEKGTGLGLSTVFGIAKQHNGHIFVNSDVNRGTTFTIYFPVADETVVDMEEYQKGVMPHGTETILIVEDESSVRHLISETLHYLGYNLLEAESGSEALELINNSEQDIHLILTDMILPGMKGAELIKAVKPKLPDAKIIYMSGYTDDIIKSENYSKPGVIYLQKPLMPSILARKLREVLDDPEKGVAA